MLVTGDEVGKYLVLRPLGAGAFGAVFHVHDRALNQEKAIKIINATDPADALTKIEEAQILNKCRHKHIVQINEANIFSVAGIPQVILDMEFITGGSLENRIEQGFVGVCDTMRFITEALFGLEYAHNQGFLHRDVKPANILLDNIYVKLSDFGHATQFNIDGFAAMKGYVSHLAPEVFLTKRTSCQTDIYSIGLTFFRTVNNIQDWNALLSSFPTKLEMIQQGRIVEKVGFAEHIPYPIRLIIRKACNVDPCKRYQNAGEMRQAIEKLKINIDWNCYDPQCCKGSCQRTGNQYEVQVTSKNKVFLRRNGRVQHANTFQCSSTTEAERYLRSFMAKTTLL